jgi:hypothetical protein
LDICRGRKTSSGLLAHVALEQSPARPAILGGSLIQNGAAIKTFRF